VRAEVARLRRFDRRLAAFPAASLSPKARHDYRVLRAAIANELFSFEDMASYTSNPMTYANVLDVNIYIKRDFAPLPDRVRSIIAIEKEAPRVMAAARANLEASLPKPYVETAIEVADGSATFLAQDLVTALKDFREEPLRAQFLEANERAITELKGYAAWLREQRLPRAHDRYAIGRERSDHRLRANDPLHRLLKLVG
jgi:hypothetical protein